MKINSSRDFYQVKLYKYRSLGDSSSRDRVRDILVNHRLYAGTFSSMNDPFEGRASWVNTASRKQKEKQALAHVQEQRPDLTKKSQKRVAKEQLVQLEQNFLARVDSILADKRLISFGGKVDNLLMWSHYANAHNGVAIEFGASSADHAIFIAAAMAVQYGLDMPTLNFFRDKPRDYVPKLLLRKSRVWAYEEEYRILPQALPVLDGGAYTEPYFIFPKELITGIFLGAKTERSDISLIRGWISEGNLSVRLHKASISNSRYELDFTCLE